MMKRASALIIISRDKTRILLQHRDMKNCHFAGQWGLIGGAAEFSETAEECANRECLEEIGQQPLNLTPIFEIQEHCLETIFIAELKNEDNLFCYEGQEIKFVPIKELDNIEFSDYHKRIINLFLESTNL